jgi:glutathione peroxidase
MSLERFAGRVVLVVNTASKCGFTPHYAGLESLYRKCAKQGFVILGFLCNQFGHQEPGGSEAI